MKTTDDGRAVYEGCQVWVYLYRKLQPARVINVARTRATVLRRGKRKPNSVKLANVWADPDFAVRELTRRETK